MSVTISSSRGVPSHLEGLGRYGALPRPTASALKPSGITIAGGSTMTAPGSAAESAPTVVAPAPTIEVPAVVTEEAGALEGAGGFVTGAGVLGLGTVLVAGLVVLDGRQPLWLRAVAGWVGFRALRALKPQALEVAAEAGVVLPGIEVPSIEDLGF